MFDAKGGEGSSMLDLGGACEMDSLGGACEMDSFFCMRWTHSFACYFMHSCLLLCIKLYLCDSDIYVIVICDMCALYFESFICHITSVMLICFASAFYSDANELCYLYSCLFYIF